MQNRKAKFDYEFTNRYTAGIILTSSEVKSLRTTGVSFTDSHIILKNGELYVTGLYIPRYKPASFNNHIETRERKLLLRKKEVGEIIKKMTDKGIVVIPLSIIINNGKFKMVIGVGRGKKNRDKRQTIKDRDQKREMERSIQ
jgi:SsrA-binding protein